MSAIEINQKIVAYRIFKEEDNEAPVVNDATPETMHENVSRPERLHGETYKIKTPLSDHALYITINDIVLNPGTVHEQFQPFEIFINSKNMENFQWVVALTRVISAVFRKGGDITFLVDELKAVFDPTGGYFKSGGVFMPSLVAEIGSVIESHLKNIGMLQPESLSNEQKKILEEKHLEYIKAESTEDTAFPKDALLCFKCHNKAVILMDGCKTCLNCGDSKCG
ncbi:NrdJb [uncultured Pseudoteredinibacter sp.]|uniref:TSCPD domain-containing protein n=1 Tax=uncultured Pseudoteredinibacter sp. TaxID=1641701 RepID=UPI00262F36A4|nr:NrdJb [uncultured Pseudoteredinibacter sp.]